MHILPFHLTYCLNIHRGESWAENFAAIREKAVAVRDRMAPGKPFGLGLRLSAQAAKDLQEPGVLDEAKAFFDANNLYAFTINGFPYGQFHAGRVKENVYKPDWRTPERRDYTVALAHILAGLLPDGIDGSISTVPGSFKSWIQSPNDVELMVTHLAECAQALHGIREKTGKEIHLGLEPEPSCFLETTYETVRFFKEALHGAGRKKLSTLLGCDISEADEILRRHTGICLDTCHAAIQFEDLAGSLRSYENEGIRVSKIQVSAALRAAPEAAALQALEPFCEPVYLHQVKARNRNGLISSWDDLHGALHDIPQRTGIDELRVHFHVPLFVEKYGTLSSTANALTPAFYAQLHKSRVTHLEIETYTFDVLPEALRSSDVTQSIAAEYEWFMRQLSENREATDHRLLH